MSRPPPPAAALFGPADREGSDAALMAELGIVRVPAARFRVDDYLYTRLADAIAQARRRRPGEER